MMFTATLGPLIAPTLERRFPPSARHGTIYPAPKHSEGAEGATKGGLVTAFSKFYTDNVLFPLIVSVLPWEASPPAFIEDRAKLLGRPINLEQFAEGRPSSISLFSSHLLLLEEQLSDSREWLSDTKALSLTDISVHFLLAWGRRMPTVASLFDESRFPLTIAWLDRVSAAITALKATQTPPSKLSGETAARKIVSAPHEPYDVVGFDTIEATRLGVGLGDTVQVAPDDYGKDYPTNGKLVALSRSELTLEVQGSEGLLRCHFPRLGYVVKRASV
ncbi:hypothetical protein JR316_0005157 [Psilocybe cubensis]|uniref:Uncharacterized protein n=2 Tax=Psilocybe cubensis TaxID=181762 RepID=A0ACB8H5Z5_PSICU|nr:hypothetical protein JR316_0005157 [Psilocybe cubensis]KAH9483057.1 hypothetical protein JR316_0005157 [Psilocybe cubensis]